VRVSLGTGTSTRCLSVGRINRSNISNIYNSSGIEVCDIHNYRMRCTRHYKCASCTMPTQACTRVRLHRRAVSEVRSPGRHVSTVHSPGVQQLERARTPRGLLLRRTYFLERGSTCELVFGSQTITAVPKARIYGFIAATTFECYPKTARNPLTD
jgi:hypothetical protein